MRSCARTRKPSARSARVCCGRSCIAPASAARLGPRWWGKFLYRPCRCSKVGPRRRLVAGVVARDDEDACLATDATLLAREHSAVVLDYRLLLALVHHAQCRNPVPPGETIVGEQ